MNRKDFEKVLVPYGAMAVADLTAEEKRQLYALMVRKGASEAFGYDRFFKEGFAQWEIDGIWQCKIDYLHHLHTDEKLELDIKGDNLVHYTADGTERTFDLKQAGDFWRFLGDIRKRIHFGDYMSRLGMKSQTTVSKRFAVDDWKEYELTGIRQVTDEYCDEMR